MKLLSCILVLSFFISSCSWVNGEKIRGNGNISAQKRAVSNFTGVDVSGALDIVVTQDSAFSVRVEADDNLHQYLKTEIVGSVLKVYAEEGYDLDGTKDIIIHVSAPSYLVFEASGASSITAANRISNKQRISLNASGASSIEMEVDTPEVFTDLTGASDVILGGQAKTHTGEASGASTIKAYDLMTEISDIEVSGASHAQVFASITLTANASGASDVKFKGTPTLSSNVSGASDISKAN